MPLTERQAKLAEIEALRSCEAGEEVAVARLLAHLSDPDDEVRTTAAAAAWDYPGSAPLVKRLLALLATEACHEVRVRAIVSLGRVVYEADIAGALDEEGPFEVLDGDPDPAMAREVCTRLTALAEDREVPVGLRRFAVEALGFVGWEQPVRRLILELLEEPDEEARVSAVFAIGRSGSNVFAGQVMELLEGRRDHGPKVRDQAIDAAGELGLEAAAPILRRELRDADDEERADMIIHALAQIPDPLTIELFTRMLEDDELDHEQRQLLEEALDELVMLDDADTSAYEL